MNRAHLARIAVTVLVLVVLAGCAAGPNGISEPGAAGFWLGLWHGLIIPVTFVVSLFTDTVNIYEVHNSGNWYDVGYVIGLSVILGVGKGGSAASR